jgi:hypothetical protein
MIYIDIDWHYHHYWHHCTYTHTKKKQWETYVQWWVIDKVKTVIFVLHTIFMITIFDKKMI